MAPAPDFFRPRNALQNAGKRAILYLAQCGDFLKIGITEETRGRVREMRTGNPVPIIIEAEISVPKSLCFQIEKRLHKQFSELRASGEWFSVRKDAVLEALAPMLKEAEVRDRRWVQEVERAPFWAADILRRRGEPEHIAGETENERDDRAVVACLSLNL